MEWIIVTPYLNSTLLRISSSKIDYLKSNAIECLWAKGLGPTDRTCDVLCNKMSFRWC